MVGTLTIIKEIVHSTLPWMTRLAFLKSARLLNKKSMLHVEIVPLRGGRNVPTRSAYCFSISLGTIGTISHSAPDGARFAHPRMRSGDAPARHTTAEDAQGARRCPRLDTGIFGTLGHLRERP
jgi:hypothetical protein